MRRLVVTDTSCLIALERIDQLDLLPSLFSVYAPGAVVEEFGVHPDWLTMEHVPEEAIDTPLLRTLDRGEAEAIVLAQAYVDAVLLIDEVRGRSVARQLGLPVTGTAGILLRAKDAGLVSAVTPLIDALVATHGFRLSTEVYRDILRAAGEAE